MFYLIKSVNAVHASFSTCVVDLLALSLNYLPAPFLFFIFILGQVSANTSSSPGTALTFNPQASAPQSVTSPH